MRIDGPAAPRQAIPVTPPVRHLVGLPALSATDPMAAPAAGTRQPMQSVAMLVTLAAASPEQRRKTEIACVGDGLDQLAALHADLSAGAVRPPRLHALREWVRRRLRSSDPGLAALADEVELRILVELAKFQVDR